MSKCRSMQGIIAGCKMEQSFVLLRVDLVEGEAAKGQSLLFIEMSDGALFQNLPVYRKDGTFDMDSLKELRVRIEVKEDSEQTICLILDEDYYRAEDLPEGGISWKTAEKR